MSAYVENKRHIDALVTAAHEFNRGAMHVWYDGHARYEATDDELGRLLWLENVRSVEARYEDVRESHTNYPGPIDFERAEVEAYTWAPLVEPLTMVELLKAINGYEYQACEHHGWKESSARAFVEFLTGEAIRHLDGYNDANTWEVDSDRPVKSVYHARLRAI